MARVAEKRQVTESGFWGREVPSVQKDIPAYWSTASHGQPFNDVRLTLGSGARWKVEGPASLRQSAPKNLGPSAAVSLGVSPCLVCH